MPRLWFPVGLIALSWLVIPPAGATGASLFARLFTPPGAPAAVVPYPLDALLARLRTELAEPDTGLPLVLIPLGRSLQRHTAGAAHYFANPRVVIAVTGQPAGTDHLLLRDRLYIGFHEAAGVLEIISYNDDAGRFEFEIVDNYRAGATPRLHAGNRGLCLACHQNDAPLFSRPTWDETSANPAIARLLAGSDGAFQTLPWRGGVDIANAIDEASERANLLGPAQAIWQHGCASADTDAAVACRARLLWRTLLVRLGAPDGGALVDDPALAPLTANWPRLWPDGLPIPSPDIPNRQPFAATLPWQTLPTGANALNRIADVAERFDPLTVRAPIAHWRHDDTAALRPVLHALGQFISDTDVAALTAQLAAATSPDTATPLICTRRERPARTDLDCTAPDLRLSARLQGDQLRVDQLMLDGVRHTGLRLAREADGRHIPIGTPPRTTHGTALRALRLDAGAEAIVLGDDLAPLRAHVDRLATTTRAGQADALGKGPLRRTAVLAPLLAMPASPPVPPAAPLAARRAPDLPELAPFHAHCGLCHDSPDAFPPGFLHGDAAAARAAVDRCAPRMLRRLAMWEAPAGQREKTPMPPPASTQAGALQAGSELARMRTWLTTRVQASGLNPDTLAARPYAELPDCAVY